MTATLIVILVQALLTIAGSAVAWKLLIPVELAENVMADGSPAPAPTKLQWVGSALQCFMLGFFWFITGPGYGIYKLVQHFKK